MSLDNNVTFNESPVLLKKNFQQAFDKQKCMCEKVGITMDEVVALFIDSRQNNESSAGNRIK